MIDKNIPSIVESLLTSEIFNNRVTGNWEAQEGPLYVNYIMMFYLDIINVYYIAEEGKDRCISYTFDHKKYIVVSSSLTVGFRHSEGIRFFIFLTG